MSLWNSHNPVSSFTYTPTGDTRVNFVGHGADFNQEGAQSLADKVKILQ
jgi:hypothetical protein